MGRLLNYMVIKNNELAQIRYILLQVTPPFHDQTSLHVAP